MKATNMRLLMLLLGCALAYAFTIGVAPRSFSGRARQFKVQLDREAAIARAREIAGQLGYETSNWKAMVSTRLLEGDVAMFELTEPLSGPPPVTATRPHLLSAIVFNVQLHDRSSDRSLRVESTSTETTPNWNRRWTTSTRAPKPKRWRPGGLGTRARESADRPRGKIAASQA
ncbi:MAG: hypothetical protein ACOYLN_06135 [Blastocatellia bacterium]